MDNFRISRRNILRGLGLGSAAHMLLPDICNPAYAADAVPKNFIVLYSYHGDGVNNANQASLWGNGNGGLTLGQHLQPLNDFKNDMILVGGLTMQSANLANDGQNAGHVKGQLHSLTSMPTPAAVFDSLSARAFKSGGPSIDQAILAQLVQKNAGKPLTPIDSLQLAIMDRTYEGQMLGGATHRPDGTRINVLRDPRQAWGKLFDTFDAGGGVPGGGDPSKNKLRQIVGKFSRGQYDNMARKVADVYGTNSRDRFQAHVDYMRKLETSLSELETGNSSAPKPTLSQACVVPEKNKTPNTPSTPAGWLSTLQEHMPKLLHLGLACGRTRFATLYIEESVTGDPGIHEKIHSLDVPGTNSYYTQISKEVAKVLKLLKDTPTADGKNLLYHSVILWAGELGKGDHSWNSNVNWVVAGQAGGALETGRYVDGSGRYTSDLFVSLGKLMDSGMTTFGDQRAFKGALPAIKA